MPAVFVEFHPSAIAEAHAAKAWYFERSSDAADAFLSEVDRAVALIAADPDRWPEHLFGTRRLLLRRFPYALIYRCEAGIATVFALAHARRRPGYWQHRR